MADWTRGMRRTYEYWKVDPGTWRDVERLENVTGCTIIRDLDDDTLGHATIRMDAWEGEAYIRIYLVTSQGGLRERWPLGTFLFQASDWAFDGMRGSAEITGHTPLKELADDMPPIGYPIGSGTTSAVGAAVMSAHCRAPVTPSGGGVEISAEYTAEPSDTWLDVARFILAKGGERPDVDSRGAVSIAPIRNPKAVAPSFVFDDGNSSILLPAVSVANNMPDVPNVVEVVYSNEGGILVAQAVNADEEDLASTARRGRRVMHRETAPSLPDNPDWKDVAEAARRLMDEMGAAVCEATYEHAYVPDVAPGCGVLLAYSSAGLNVNAMVVSQTIECTPACKVTETARYMA